MKEKSVVDSGLDPFIQLESMRLTACLAVSKLAVVRALHVIGVWSVLVDEISKLLELHFSVRMGELDIR